MNSIIKGEGWGSQTYHNVIVVRNVNFKLKPAPLPKAFIGGDEETEVM